MENDEEINQPLRREMTTCITIINYTGNIRVTEANLLLRHKELRYIA